ncbi:MAG TPA: adenine phosphoribosyltransferase [Armatimonadota bacterium]|nr:adenine phosphoribosyltransferase [Armatimonadota bacterium]
MELLAKRLIRDIQDFPKAGIVFKDIAPVLKDPAAFQESIDRMLKYGRARAADVVVGIESRGFIFGAPLALALGVGFVPVRKLGKLPGETIRAEYSLEYGTNTVEMQKDAIQPGQRALVVDDLLATGGTSAAAAELIEALGGEVAGMVFLVELGFLNGREMLDGYDYCSLVEL